MEENRQRLLEQAERERMLEEIERMKVPDVRPSKIGDDAPI